MPKTRVTVSKKDAATCQLETSIKLFLEDRDLVSAYTLCCAADGILEGIYGNERETILKKQLNRSPITDGLRFSWGEEVKSRIKPEYYKEVVRTLNAPQNFFKHADKDYDSSYQFPDWELTGIRLITTIMNYNLVFGEITAAMGLYITLYAIINPNLLAEGNPLLDKMSAMAGTDAVSENLTREDIAIVGYFALESTCPELFKKPRKFGNIRLTR